MTVCPKLLTGSMRRVHVARALVLADLALSLISWNVDGIWSAGKNWYELTMVEFANFVTS